jgi:hypothetical protein
VIDKNLKAASFEGLVPGTILDAKTIFPQTTYKGPQRDDEDYSHVLQLAFEEHACVITSDYAMIGKAERFHSYVVGHRGDRCMNGVIVLQGSLADALASVKRFRSGTTRVRMPGAGGVPFRVDLGEVYWTNLGLNLRASPPTVCELCKCAFTN